MADTLLDAARAVFEQYGARRANIDDIARVAGISRSTLYQAEEQIQHGQTAGAVSTLGVAAIGSLLSILLPILGAYLLYRIGKAYYKWDAARKKAWAEHQGRVHGSARWMEGAELDACGMKGPSAQGLVVGLWNDGKTSDLIRFHEKGHLLTFAPTGPIPFAMPRRRRRTNLQPGDKL